MSDYQITDEDIDGMMHFLEISHPERANREYAYIFLDYIKSGLHNIARENPDNIEALYEQFEASKKEETEEE